MSPEITKLQPIAPASPHLRSVSTEAPPDKSAPPGSAGPTGPTGSVGPTGPAGPAGPPKTVKVRPKRIYPWKKIVTAAILLGGVVFILGYGWKIWQFAQEKDLPKTTVSLPAVDEAALAAIRSRATGVAGQNFDQVPTGTRTNPFSGAPAPTTPTP